MTVVDLLKLETQLTGEEGRKNYPYTDSRGNITIGVGRNLTGVGLRDGEIETLYQNDIAQVQSDLAANLPWVFDLDEVRLRVFYDLCFNMGVTTLLGFKDMLAHAQAGNWNTAAGALQNSAWYEEVGGRAVKLVAMLQTGLDQ